eukprot:4225175-Prymnesium_polylepis.2
MSWNTAWRQCGANSEKSSRTPAYECCASMKQRSNGAPACSCSIPSSVPLCPGSVRRRFDLLPTAVTCVRPMYASPRCLNRGSTRSMVTDVFARSTASPDRRWPTRCMYAAKTHAVQPVAQPISMYDLTSR